MTLTNVEKELIATQIYDLDKSFENVVSFYRNKIDSHEYDTYLEHLRATRAVIKDLKKYWIDQQ